MLVVGLTGGIASGKSTVVRMFKEMGASVIDTDVLSRVVVEPGRPAWRDIVAHFGEQVVNPDRTLDRKALGRIVFGDPRARKVLEGFVHPRVLEKQASILAKIRQRDPRAIVLIDVPLLIEVGWADRMDAVVLVYATREIQMERLVNRQGFSPEEAELRLRAQMPIDAKIEHATFVIDNTGDLAQTERQVREVFGELREMERSKPGKNSR